MPTMMSKKTILIGGAGHAKVLIDILRLQEQELIGILDPELERGTSVLDVPVLGDDGALDNFSSDEVQLVNGMGVLPGRIRRWDLAQTLRIRGFEFLSVIHPAAIICSDVVLESGVQVMAGVVIQSGTTVGRDSVLNTGVLIDHDCELHAQCWLSPGATLCGSVTVGVGAYLGAGCTILQNVEITDLTLVPAGATVG